MPLAALSFRFRHAGLTAASAFGASDEPAGPYQTVDEVEFR